MSKLNIYFITIHPDFFSSYFKFGVFKQALESRLLNVEVINLRDFALDLHGSVDDKPFGGDDGMILKPEPLAAAIKSLPKGTKVIYTSPSGKLWNQTEVSSFQNFEVANFAFICGRFSGLDQRIIDNGKKNVEMIYNILNDILEGSEGTYKKVNVYLMDGEIIFDNESLLLKFSYNTRSGIDLSGKVGLGYFETGTIFSDYFSSKDSLKNWNCNSCWIYDGKLIVNRTISFSLLLPTV